MFDSYKSKDFFLKCFPLWDYVAIDATDLSEGLISGWNPLSVDLQDFHTFVGILMEGCLKGVSSTVKILNCFGPYQDRLSFWKLLEESDFIREEGLIIGGNLNFTTSMREI